MKLIRAVLARNVNDYQSPGKIRTHVVSDYLNLTRNDDQADNLIDGLVQNWHGMLE